MYVAVQAGQYSQGWHCNMALTVQSRHFKFIIIYATEFICLFKAQLLLLQEMRLQTGSGANYCSLSSSKGQDKMTPARVNAFQSGYCNRFVGYP